jgi:DNA mismatch repair ATPase MutS
MPDFFTDLNLDQIVQGILSGREEYNLDEFFYSHLRNIEAIKYRQEIMADLEDDSLYNGILDFTYAMIKIREHLKLSKDLHNQYQQDRWFLEAALAYCGSLMNLHTVLGSRELKSKGLNLFLKWLDDYLDSENFRRLSADATKFTAEFNKVRYSIQVDNDRIIISDDDSEDDYCAGISDIFKGITEKEETYELSVFSGVEMNPLEIKIMNIVADMYKDTFKNLDIFYTNHKGFLSTVIKSFDREIQFYLAYLAYIRRLKESGMPFDYPGFSDNKEINIAGGYDLALAKKLSGSGTQTDIVYNNLTLDRGERIIVLTGPNQGGKTTYTRMFGQILYLSSLGCCVPCTKATVFMFDSIYTLFPVEEDLSKNAGRLKEELVRLNKQLKGATSDSVYLVNEFLTSTTSYDAYTLGKRLLNTLLGIDCVCLYITHITELASASSKIISMVATVRSEEDTSRTFHIVRRTADGNVYVNPIVEQYRLTFDEIKERINK